MCLRTSKEVRENAIHDVIAYAENAKGKDIDGYRAEFVRLVKTLE